MNTLFEKKLFEKTKNYKNKKILLGFSGGIDSTALLYFLAQNRFNVVACHINHSIRGSLADYDETFCQNFCEKYNIRLIVKKIDVPNYVQSTGLSVEEAARKLRYDTFFKVFEEGKFDIIFTAHHRDDVIENFFIKVFQGSSLSNLKGFNFREDILLRPMIEIDKKVIVDFVSTNQLDYVEDETNFSTDYLRNWVRHNIIPNIKSYNENYFNNIIRLQEESGELKQYLNNKIKDIDFENNGIFYKCSISLFNKLDNFEKKYLLSEFFKNFFRVEKRHIDLALTVINSTDSSKRIILPKDCIFEKSYGNIYFFYGRLLKGFNYKKKVDENELVIDDFGKKIEFLGSYTDKELMVRTRCKGDRFMGKKLKDIFIDKKIDLFIRDISCVIELNGEIIYVENVSRDENIKIHYI